MSSDYEYSDNEYYEDEDDEYNMDEDDGKSLAPTPPGVGVC